MREREREYLLQLQLYLYMWKKRKMYKQKNYIFRVISLFSVDDIVMEITREIQYIGEEIAHWRNGFDGFVS